MSTEPDPDKIRDVYVMQGPRGLLQLAHAQEATIAALSAQVAALESDAQRSLEERIAMAVDQARLQLPKSYGGSTLDVQEKGATLRLHFTDAKEAQAWFKAITAPPAAMASAAQEG